MRKKQQKKTAVAKAKREEGTRAGRVRALSVRTWSTILHVHRSTCVQLELDSNTEAPRTSTRVQIEATNTKTETREYSSSSGEKRTGEENKPVGGTATVKSDV